MPPKKAPAKKAPAKKKIAKKAPPKKKKATKAVVTRVPPKAAPTNLTAAERRAAERRVRTAGCMSLADMFTGPSVDITEIKLVERPCSTSWLDESAPGHHPTKRELLSDPAFFRHVFAEVNKLRVAGKKTKKQRAEEQAALPAFDDFDRAAIMTWGASSLPSGRLNPPGMNVSLYIRLAGVDLSGNPADTCSWYCRLNTDLTLMTGVSSWKGYNAAGQPPLWPASLPVVDGDYRLADPANTARPLAGQ